MQIALDRLIRMKMRIGNKDSFSEIYKDDFLKFKVLRTISVSLRLGSHRTVSARKLGVQGSRKTRGGIASDNGYVQQTQLLYISCQHSMLICWF